MRSLLCIVFAAITFNAVSQSYFIAHRGASFLAPENSLSSVNTAWQNGAEYVEIDVWLSNDQRVMVCHDDSLIRLTGTHHVISETDSDILRSLDIGSWKDTSFRGEAMPFLEEVIQTIPDHGTLVIEVKCGSEIILALKKIVQASEKRSQLRFISFGWQTILALKNAFPDHKCYWLSEKQKDLETYIVLAAKYGLDGINLDHTLIDPSVVALARKHGLEVLSWTIDDPMEAKRLINLSVTGITTNRPKWLADQLKK